MSLNIEREKRGANESLRFKNISGNHKIQQWKQFLRDHNNKSASIRFLCDAWKSQLYCSKLNSRIMFLAYEVICVKLTSSNVVEMEALYCTHEEADTRILLHAKNATEYEAVVLVCEDTDVLLLAISKAADLGSSSLPKKRNRN